MSTKPLPQALPIRQALDQSAPLVRLLQRLRESEQRFAAVQSALPPPLRRSVRAGPLDETGWTLLAANAAVAAKLRHVLPTLTQALSEAGWPALVLRVKIEQQTR